MQIIPRQTPKPTLDEQRWQIVQSRRNASSTSYCCFYYAVISTKIFCRPTCPSRRPRRANVRFFNYMSDALDAGFRPCKRCKPDRVVDSEDDASRLVVKKAKKFIVLRNGVVTLIEIAEHVGLSPRYFRGLFKGAVGVTPAGFAAGVGKRDGVGKKLGIGSGEVAAIDAEDSSIMMFDSGLQLLGLDFADGSLFPDDPSITSYDDCQLQAQHFGTDLPLENLNFAGAGKDDFLDDYFELGIGHDTVNFGDFSCLADCALCNIYSPGMNMAEIFSFDYYGKTP